MESLTPPESPALSLPPEILSVILSLSGHSRTGPNAVQLAHVCRQWRHVLLGLSEYWADTVASFKFSEETDVPFLSFILDRSSPRRIKLHDTCLFPSISIALAPHWHRVVYLDVTIPSEDRLRELHAIFQDGPSSGLRRLFVRFQPMEYDISKVQLTPLQNGALPSLIRLRTPVFFLPFVTVPSIRYLQISSSKGWHTHKPVANEALDILFDALAICTKLETLTIGTLSEDRLHIFPSTTRNVYMRRLKILSINGCCFGQTYAILCTLGSPVTTDVKIDCCQWLQSDGIRDVVLPDWPPSADTVRMTVHNARVFMLEVAEGDAARFNVRHGVYYSFEKDIAEVCSKRPTVTKFECASLVDPDHRHAGTLRLRWNEILPGFSNITRLSVRRQDPCNIARALQCWTSPPAGTGLPPCPHLEDLAIAWHDFSEIGTTVRQRGCAAIDAFVESLTSRRQLGVTPLRLLELHHHKPNPPPPAEVFLAPGDAQIIEDALVVVRGLVNGPVVFNIVAGPITSP